MPQESANQLNIANINRLIAKLRSLPSPEKFNISVYARYINVLRAADEGYYCDSRGSGVARYHECNTACCMAGWANFIHLTEDYKQSPGKITLHQLSNTEVAAEWLGISYMMASKLFTSSSCATLSEAICALEMLRDTGDFSWARVRGYEDQATAQELSYD